MRILNSLSTTQHISRGYIICLEQRMTLPNIHPQNSINKSTDKLFDYIYSSLFYEFFCSVINSCAGQVALKSANKIKLISRAQPASGPFLSSVVELGSSAIVEIFSL